MLFSPTLPFQKVPQKTYAFCFVCNHLVIKPVRILTSWFFKAASPSKLPNFYPKYKYLR